MGWRPRFECTFWGIEFHAFRQYNKSGTLYGLVFRLVLDKITWYDQGNMYQDNTGTGN